MEEIELPHKEGLLHIQYMRSSLGTFIATLSDDDGICAGMFTKEQARQLGEWLIKSSEEQ